MCEESGEGIVMGIANPPKRKLAKLELLIKTEYHGKTKTTHHEKIHFYYCRIIVRNERLCAAGMPCTQSVRAYGCGVGDVYALLF